MTLALDSLRQSLRAVGRGLREPRFYVALLAGVVVWVLAYQVKRDYVVEIADRAFQPYIANFYEPERTATDPPLTYRWSKGDPEIFLPGIGNEPVQLSITTIGSRPSGAPPEVTLTVHGQTFNVQTQNGEHTDTFLVERGDPSNGDFTLVMGVPTFTPAGDPRDLGVIVREVAVRPADYGLRPFVVPSLATVGQFLVGIVALYLFGLVTVRRKWISLLLLYVSILLVALGLIAVRPEMGYLAGQVPTLWAWGLLFALIGRTLLDVVLRPAGKWAEFAVAMGSAAFALTFMLRFGGMTYAHFLTSDLFLHIHNTEAVMGGDLLFTEPVPDGTQVPYPPALYVLVTAFSWLVGGSEETLGLLLKWSTSLLDAACCLGLAWAGWRLLPGALGGMAALVYAFSPGAFDLFSAGNYTNIFAQSVLNLTLLGGLVFLSGRGGKQGVVGPGLLALGFSLTMLGHYGMMLGTLPILGFFAVWMIISILRGRPVGYAAWLVGTWIIALAFSFVVYYRNFTTEMWTQWSGLYGKLTGSDATNSAQGGRPGLLDGLRKLPGKIYNLAGGLIVITGAFGGPLLTRMAPAARALLWSWLLAVALFALLDQVLGDSVRWYYLGVAPLSLLAGRFIGLLTVRGIRAKTLSGIVLGAMALYMLVFWTDLIFLRYH